MQLLINPTNSNLILDLDMSLALINLYYTEKHKLKNIAKQHSESVLRPAFARLLEGFALKRNLTLIQEFSYRTAEKNLIRFDGVLKNDMGLDFGYWEAKAQVNLEDEIRKKLNKGYPKTNILIAKTISPIGVCNNFDNIIRIN